MSIYLRTLHFAALQAELEGYVHFAAALRSELAAEILRLKGAGFFREVLALPYCQSKRVAVEYGRARVFSYSILRYEESGPVVAHHPHQVLP